MITKLFISASLFIALVDARAQNIEMSTLTWVSDEVTDIGASRVSKVKCMFKTEGKSRVEWIQRNGNLRTVFTVIGTQGVWTNVGEPGNITYVLERNGNRCRMIIERKQDGLFVTMDFSKAGEYSSIQKFKISTVN